jgi:hypothetical protein
MAKQINVNQEKIENTQIVINVKTLLVILGFMISGLSGVYYKLSDDIDGAKTTVKESETSITTEIKRIDGLRRDDYKILDEKITNILLRTNSRHEENSSGNAPMTTSTQAPPQ